MKLQNRLLTAAAVAATAVATPAARALVSLEDGKDHLFVDGSVEFGYDSNVFANADSGGSMVYQGSLGIDFTRRAGWIGVNASASVSFARYGSFREQNYVDPKVTAEFTKQTGRTTGSLTFSVQRENRADVTINTRDVSWNYDAGLNFQYPVIERYSISGSFDYNRIDYQDQALFTDLSTYTENLYLYYILNEQRDLFIDYRLRDSDEAGGDYDLDNSLNVGVSGRVYGPFNGSLQAGYETRTSHGGVDSGEEFSTINVSGSATWNMSRRMTLTATLSRDYSTTATAESIESTNGGLTFQDSFTAKASTTLSALVGENKFLGDEGLLEPSGVRRIDTFADLSAAYFYTVNQHLKASVSYSYYLSHSTLAYADFPRHQVDFTLSSHW
jgi:hypothetical protein